MTSRRGRPRRTHCTCGVELPPTGRNHGRCHACRYADNMRCPSMSPEARRERFKRWYETRGRAHAKAKRAADALAQAAAQRQALRDRQAQEQASRMGYSGKLGARL